MCTSRLRYAVRVLLGICVLAGGLLPARGQAVRCAATGEAVPHGVVVLLPSGERNYRAMNLAMVKNPSVSGVAVQINWRDIEPVQGTPDWSQLDALFAAAKLSKKWVHLIMFPASSRRLGRSRGCRTRSVRDPIRAGQRHGGAAADAVGSRLPRPLVRVHAIVERAVWWGGRVPDDRGRRADIGFCQMTLPNSPPAHRRWLADGYTPTRYLGAWDNAFRFYATAFPNQCSSLSAPALPILGPGPKNRAARVRARNRSLIRRCGCWKPPGDTEQRSPRRSC